MDEWKIYYWFANFPLLLQNWISKFQDYVDLSLIDQKMKNKMQRNFICNDKTNRYIYTWYVSEISLEKLPDILIKLWCYNALNLDAWWSSAMIYNSKYLIWPGRDIMDWVIIERKWLDTKKIIENAKNIQLFIESKIESKTIEEKVVYIDELSKSIWNLRKKIYNQNSIDIIENWKKIWYEIDIKNLKKLQTTYMINYLNKLLYETKDKYLKIQKQQIEDEKQRIEEEIKLKNQENMLF